MILSKNNNYKEKNEIIYDILKHSNLLIKQSKNLYFITITSLDKKDLKSLNFDFKNKIFNTLRKSNKNSYQNYIYVLEFTEKLSTGSRFFKNLHTHIHILYDSDIDIKKFKTTTKKVFKDCNIDLENITNRNDKFSISNYLIKQLNCNYSIFTNDNYNYKISKKNSS
ncbi:hypothetical protein [Flavobacterium sp. U410]